MMSSCSQEEPIAMDVFETSASGNQMTAVDPIAVSDAITSRITIDTEKRLQTITGFGGAFTESSAYLLNQLSDENRATVLRAYFGKEGANYSLTRTHMNSCDFSLSQYSYAPVADDMRYLLSGEFGHFQLRSVHRSIMIR